MISIVYYAVILVTCGALGALGVLDLDVDIVTFLSGAGWIIPAMLMASVLLLLISWQLSIHFYLKREL